MPPRKISILEKLKALAEAPEEGAAPKERSRRRLTTKQKAAVGAAKKPHNGQKGYFPEGRGKSKLRGSRSIIGTRHIDRILMAMVPGHWHSAGDLRRATGTDALARLREMTQRGLVVRGKNTGAGKMRRRDPATERAYTTPWRVWEPTWVFRLSGLGEEVRRAVVVIGLCGA